MSEREGEQGIRANQPARADPGLQPDRPQPEVPRAASVSRRSSDGFDSGALVSAERQKEYEKDRAAFLAYTIGPASLGLLGWLTARDPVGLLFLLASLSCSVYMGAIIIVICWAARRDRWGEPPRDVDGLTSVPSAGQHAPSTAIEEQIFRVGNRCKRGRLTGETEDKGQLSTMRKHP